MKVVILCGGLGSRLSEETQTRPKPMVEIGGQPILWHIMKTYAAYGFNEFVIAVGYKADVIKEYFLNFYYMRNNFSIHLHNGDVSVSKGAHEDWTVHVVDTGLETQTGGRIKRVKQWLGDETFLLTYGDAVGNINIRDLVAFHKKNRKLATVTAVRPPARFGALQFHGDLVTKFDEKPQTGEGWINGGFFVLEPQVLEYISGDDSIFEREPLERLAEDQQLVAFQHPDFWQCMDTLRDLRLLDRYWQSGQAAWKVWE